MTQARPSNPRGNGPTHSQNQIKWNIGVDTGGTFTDCVARHSDGRIARAKVLSTSALRGVVRGGSEHTLVIEFASGLLQDNVADFFTGFVIRAAGGAVFKRRAFFSLAMLSFKLARPRPRSILAT